jgi:hypothetical protein
MNGTNVEYLRLISSFIISSDWLWEGRSGATEFRFPAGAMNFSLRHRFQIVSGAHPISYSMRIEGSFLGGKAAGT